MAAVQQRLNQKPLKVKIDVDTASIIAQIDQATRDRTVKVKLDMNVRPAQLAALRVLQTLSDKSVRFRVNLDLTQAELQRIRDLGPALRSIRTLSDKSVRIRVNLDMSAEELARLQAIAPALRSLRGLSDKDVRIRIRIEVDEAQLMRIAALLRQIRSQTTNIRVNTNADDANRGISRLGASLSGLAKFTGIAAGVVAGIAAIGGAAGVAAGAVGGLAAGLLALAPAAAAIGVTSFVGLQGIGDAFTALGNLDDSAASVEKFNEAMANLSPNAREFVLAVRDIAPAWEAFRKSIQDTLLVDLGTQLKETANVTLPAIQQSMGGVATQLNLAAQNALEFLRSARGIDGLNTAFDNAANLLKGMREGTGEFTQGMLDIGTAAAPVMEKLGTDIASVFEGFGRAFSASAASGELTAVFSGFGDSLRGLGSLLEGVVSSLLTIGKDVLPALKPLFESLGGALKEIAPSLGQLGKVFAESLTAIMPELAILIRALAEGLKPILPVVANLLIAIGQAIQPLIKPISDLAVSVGNTLVEVFKALQPSIGPLAEAFVSIFNAVAPLIPLFAESLSAVLVAIAPSISTVANALAPLIKMFADQMKPVLEELKPVLQEMASTIGLALADAIKEIAPLLPDLVSSFSDLIIAVIPLLPELVKLALEILPPLISIMKDLLPILTDMIDAFTWFVQNVLIPYVLPALQMLTKQWSDTFNQVADIVHWITDTVLPKIGEQLTNVKNEFSSAVEFMGNAWSKLGDVMAVPVNFVITTVLNNGLFKAWNSVSDLLGGSLGHIDPLSEIPKRATGGPIRGPGSGTSDEILTWLSNNEHVVTAGEVLKAGGHNILFAIRDMIARGIPFTWDNGQIITQLGRGNLDAYGAAVASKGIGNVSPEGLFSQLIPRFQAGGPILPWMYQLQKGHDFARSQNGKPYKWAGPQFVGDSFDCSGFMGAIAAAILGMNPWQRYWSTGSFSGQQVGPQGFTKNQADGGFVVGISNGGEGGGHTAGVLGAIAELGYAASRVESGGAIGDVHYGRGTDPRSFQMLYGLPIGANGFFQPGAGGTGGSVGPTPVDQMSFLAKVIKSMIEVRTLPVRAAIKAIIGNPPPQTRRVPPEFLDRTESAMSVFLAEQPGKLGDALGGVWQKATDLGGKVLDAINPFDSGGIATGTGVLTKNTIEPERVLSPEQTRLFEALVESLQSIAGSPSAAVPDLLTANVFQQGITLLAKNLGDIAARNQAAVAVPDQQPTNTEQQTSIQILGDKIDKIVVTTQDLVLRTESSKDLALATQAAQIQSGMDELAQMLTDQALIPIMESAVSEGIGILRKWLDAGADQVTAGTDRTTSAVLSTGGSSGGGGSAPFGSPGSAFDAVSAISDAIVGVANTARQAFESVANSIAQAALAQTPSKADPSKGRLGTDISGGTLVDTLVRLTGVEIDIRDTLVDTWEEIHAFRGDLVAAFDESGRVITDTADLVQRNESSRELVVSEMERINKALIKALLKYLILNVLLPIITAILGAMITLATTAIGAAIGSMIPIIGTAIGAAVGAVIGAALAGLAAVFTSVLAVGAGAAIDAFDSGGVATGVGFLPKNTLAPERVLSPRQTEDFGRLVDVLDRSQGQRNVTINAPFTVLGGQNAGNRAHNDLLALINGS